MDDEAATTGSDAPDHDEPAAGGEPEAPRRRHHWIRNAVLVLLAVVVLGGAYGAAIVVKDRRADQALQAELQPFYTPPDPLPSGDFGSLIREEPVAEDQVPEGSRAWRILYRSRDAAGDTTVSSGVVYQPSGAAPEDGYPTVVWAHGTVGMGASCAPSRHDPPLPQEDWLETMLDRGFAVVATDYSGLGTPGTLQYLIGAAETNDVVGSVIAARSMDQLRLDDQIALWGHSQGGHSVLWTAPAVAEALPDVELVAAAAAAPAAELVPLIAQQWNEPIAWAIGPEVAVAWPEEYPDLDLDAALTGPAERNSERIAQQCILEAAAEGLFRDAVLRQQFFDGDPTQDQRWDDALTEQTVPLPPAGVPVLIAQGEADLVVLPNTTSLLIERYCDAGATVATHWMPDVGHVESANSAGDVVTDWLAERFAGQSTQSDCSETPPVAPYRHDG